jgi:phosphotriesterase-related protein
MTVMTVLGPIDDDALGVTLPHEHLIANAVSQWAYPEGDVELLAERTREFSLDMRGRVQTHPFEYRHVMQQLELAPALEELAAFRARGGGTVVDLGIPGFGRDAVALKALAELSGVHIVMGCGEYVEHSHSPYVRYASAETIRDVIVDELTVGVGQTGIRAGIIGEIGTGNPPTPEELKVVRGAALAQIETGVAMNIHRSIFPDELAGLEPLDLALSVGADPAKLIVSHCDERPGAEFALEVARRGAWVELDTFGMEQWAVSSARGASYPQRAFDHHRIDILLALASEGYLGQTLLSHDMAMKPQYQRYGGWGLVHLHDTIAPQLVARGFTPADLDQLFVANPRRALSS